jgi:hydrogenase/urease accessory protein HupE
MRKDLVCVTLLFFAVAVGMHPDTIRAHPLAPSLLELHELPSGLVEVLWRTPLPRPLEPAILDGCRRVGSTRSSRNVGSATVEFRADCGLRGLAGVGIRVAGLRGSGTNALVRVTMRDGRTTRAILSGDRDFLRVPEQAGGAEGFVAYVRVGIEHIASGLDHLLFLFALVLLAPSRRSLLGTITGFTVGHSVTLSLVALGLVRVPSAPIEFFIALSILWVAVELTRTHRAGQSRRGRTDWAMTAGFGLLHGAGFAGAMVNVGLPSSEIVLALLSFNGGIELGQVGFVGGVLAARWIVERAHIPLPRWRAQGVAYAIGSVAAFWCFQRAALLL